MTTKPDTIPAVQPEPVYAVVYKSHMSGHSYAIARMIQFGELTVGVLLTEPGASWPLRLTSKPKAWAAARTVAAATRGRVLRSIYVEDYLKPHVETLKPKE